MKIDCRFLIVRDGLRCTVSDKNFKSRKYTENKEIKIVKVDPL